MKDKAIDNRVDACLPGGLIPAEQWEVPQTSVRRSFKDAVGHALEQLRVGVTQADEPFESLDELPELSAAQQRRLAPEPDYTALAEAIACCLEQAWTEGTLNQDVVCLVAPPFTGIQQVLAHFTQRGQAGLTENRKQQWRMQSWGFPLDRF